LAQIGDGGKENCVLKAHGIKRRVKDLLQRRMGEVDGKPWKAAVADAGKSWWGSALKTRNHEA